MPQIGESLLRYRLIEKIGEGGMGDVWKALDTRLDREVAVKILPEEFAGQPARLARFEGEAKAVAALNHPNIVTIHSVEEAPGHIHFITMELVRGKTLAELIPGEGFTPRRFFQIALPLADAVGAAHDAGLTHRDLKPANDMVSNKGAVKVLDFGLAHFRQEEEDAAPVSTKTLTEQREIKGTMPYMSPEQIKGEDLDNRTDLFSLGVMLYEMATGNRPFQADSSPDLIAAILRDEPRPATDFNRSLPPQTGQLIADCLRKKRDARIASAHELRERLEALRLEGETTDSTSIRRKAASAEPDLTSVAVLPLDNLSGDPQQEFFADGMTDALITDLAKIKGLKVISRMSVMQYKGVRKPLREIASELGVSAIAVGSVLRVGDRVRISAQLIDAGRDEHLWAESYDRESRDVLEVQGEVARAVAKQVRVQLTEKEKDRLTAARPVNPAAHEACMRGRHFWYKRTGEAVRKGLECFERAVELDPDYAQGWAGIADSFIVDGGRYLQVPAEQAYQRARAAAQKAVELDPDLAEAHTSLAGVRGDYDWDWDGALQEFEQAIELNPNYVTARYWYADHLSRMGDPAGALREARFAREIDPLSVVSNMMVAWVSYFARKHDDAIDQARRTIELDSGYAAAWRILGLAQAASGDFDDAIRAHEKACSLAADSPNFKGPLALAHAQAGHTETARELLADLLALESESPAGAFDIAAVHAALGEPNEAFEWLGRAVEQHGDQVPYLGVHPALDPLRDDLRFAALLRRIGLS